MDYKGKHVLVIGLGKSGLAVKEALSEKGALLTVYDQKHQGGAQPEDMSLFELAVVSPGVPLSAEIVSRAQSAGVPVIGELELAYRLAGGRFAAITGTNGKTTTTTLVWEIFRAAGRAARLAGNIGIPAVSVAKDSGGSDWLITEVSSFQLETIQAFRPAVSAVLNITPDHLDRHGSFEEYARIKGRIYENQREEDYFIVNMDDEPSRRLAESCPCRTAGFGRVHEPEVGAFVREGRIVIRDAKQSLHDICDVSAIRIPGAHNLENVLAAAALAFFAGIKPEVIGRAVTSFEGVEHRLEFVRQVHGVRFVNDSKGTNPDASVKAVKAMPGGIVLIAGGYDKGSEFDELIQSFDGAVKHLVLLGKTAQKIKETAQRLGFTQIAMAADMRECVKKAYELAVPGDTVLLSPACASWDMYSCFEERGEDFKTIVKGIR